MRELPDDELITYLADPHKMRPYPFDESLFQRTVYAPYFDGLTQYVVFESANDFIARSDDDFELSISFNRKTWNGGAFAFSTRDGSNYGLNVYLSGNGDAGLGSIGVFGTQLSSTGYASNVDYDVVIRKVGVTWYLIVNGSVVSEKVNQALPALQSANKATLAALDGGSFKMNAVVWHVSMKLNGKTLYLMRLDQRNSALQNPVIGSVTANIVNHTNAMWRPL
ncbi:hypothetical protein NM092_003359 [Vibrio cholerae]|nr:hypothetical protein [Vibrio cholerae]